MNFLRKYKIHISISIACVMVLYIVVQLGAGFFGQRAHSENEPIAEVNGTGIPLRLFYSHYRRALDQVPPGQKLDEAGRNQRRDETIRDLVQSVVFAKEAEKYGIEVPDQQVVSSLTQIQGFQDKGRFNPQLYMQALQSQLRMTPNDFEEEQRKSIAFFKLRWLIQSSIKVTDKELQMLSEFRATDKTMKPEKDPAAARQRIWQEKVMFTLNQWLGSLGRNLKVVAHPELLEGFK
jgi:peptidyl-prolyl cis-trans isomerase D